MTFSPELEERFKRFWPSIRAAKRSAVIPMLMYAQDEVGAITPELIDEVAKRCGVQSLQVDEVVGYYSMLHRKPLGKYHVQVCTNISCMLVGGTSCTSMPRRSWDRTQRSDGRRAFSLEEVECMGACSWAPAVEINYDFHHHITPEKLDALIDGLKSAKKAN
jgi:NADH-quinone oxidoreductase subunit E